MVRLCLDARGSTPLVCRLSGEHADTLLLDYLYFVLCAHVSAGRPISEPRIMKEPFDEIFSASRYHKASEKLREMARGMKLDVLEAECLELRRRCKNAEDLRTRLDEQERLKRSHMEAIAKIAAQIEPLGQRAATLQETLARAAQVCVRVCV